MGQALPSEDSLALRVVGMKTAQGISLRYQPTRQDQFVPRTSKRHEAG